MVNTSQFFYHLQNMHQIQIGNTCLNFTYTYFFQAALGRIIKKGRIYFRNTFSNILYRTVLFIYLFYFIIIELM